jgi:hypothetical protein
MIQTGTLMMICVECKHHFGISKKFINILVKYIYIYSCIFGVLSFVNYLMWLVKH